MSQSRLKCARATKRRFRNCCSGSKNSDDLRPRRSCSEARINPRRRSVRWFTAAENLWSRSFRRVPSVWEFVRDDRNEGGRDQRKRKNQEKERSKATQGGEKNVTGVERERKRDESGRWEKGAERKSEKDGVLGGWKDSTCVYKYRHCTGAKGYIFHSLFVVATVTSVPARVYAPATIVHSPGAICDRLASTESRWHRWNRPVWPLKRSHGTANHSFETAETHAFRVAEWKWRNAII